MFKKVVVERFLVLRVIVLLMLMPFAIANGEDNKVFVSDVGDEFNVIGGFGGVTPIETNLFEASESEDLLVSGPIVGTKKSAEEPKGEGEAEAEAEPEPGCTDQECCIRKGGYWCPRESRCYSNKACPNCLGSIGDVDGDRVCDYPGGGLRTLQTDECFWGPDTTNDRTVQGNILFFSEGGWHEPRLLCWEGPWVGIWRTPQYEPGWAWARWYPEGTDVATITDPGILIVNHSTTYTTDSGYWKIVNDSRDISRKAWCKQECERNVCDADGVSYYMCIDVDNDGCLDLNPAQLGCGPERHCESETGFCVDDVVPEPPICEDECGADDATVCSGENGFKTCGNYDSDDCLELSEIAIPCDAGTHCENGECIDDAQPISGEIIQCVPRENAYETCVYLSNGSLECGSRVECGEVSQGNFVGDVEEKFGILGEYYIGHSTGGNIEPLLEVCPSGWRSWCPSQNQLTPVEGNEFLEMKGGWDTYYQHNPPRRLIYIWSGGEENNYENYVVQPDNIYFSYYTYGAGVFDFTYEQPPLLKGCGIDIEFDDGSYLSQFAPLDEDNYYIRKTNPNTVDMSGWRPHWYQRVIFLPNSVVGKKIKRILLVSEEPPTSEEWSYRDPDSGYWDGRYWGFRCGYDNFEISGQSVENYNLYCGEGLCIPELDCHDGIDNDEDGLTDCDDFDCEDIDEDCIRFKLNDQLYIAAMEKASHFLNARESAPVFYLSGDIGFNALGKDLQVISPHPECGNGIIDFENNEECDGNNFGGITCTSKGFRGGQLSCVDCKIDTSSCYQCKNGILEGDELCEYILDSPYGVIPEMIYDCTTPDGKLGQGLCNEQCSGVRECVPDCRNDVINEYSCLEICSPAGSDDWCKVSSYCKLGKAYFYYDVEDSSRNYWDIYHKFTTGWCIPGKRGAEACCPEGYNCIPGEWISGVRRHYCKLGPPLSDQ